MVMALIICYFINWNRLVGFEWAFWHDIYKKNSNNNKNVKNKTKCVSFACWCLKWRWWWWCSWCEWFNRVYVIFFVNFWIRCHLRIELLLVLLVEKPRWTECRLDLRRAHLISIKQFIFDLLAVNDAAADTWRPRDAAVAVVGVPLVGEPL